MHVRTSRWATALTAGVALLALTACGGAGPSGPGESAAAAAQSGFNPQPYDNLKDGGTLTTALEEISAQFNDWQADKTGNTTKVWYWYNPVLMLSTADGKVSPNPDYLTDVKSELVGGNTRVTYTINPKAVFNDGTPIDWKAFEATWKASNGKDPAYSISSSDGYDRIASVVRGADDKQVVVTFNGVNVWWQSMFGGLLHPAAAATPDAFNKAYLNNPHNEWGAGPYQVKTYDQQAGSITFERNPKWWGKPGKLDTRTILQMDQTAAVNAFRNGQLDAVNANNQNYLTQVKDQPGTEIRKGPRLGVQYYTLNGKSPLLSDPAVRKAVFEGIDRTQVVKIHLNGLDYQAEPQDSMMLFPFQEGYSKDVPKVVTYDPAKAKADLDAAGWVAGPDGVRAKGGKPLQLAFVYFGTNTALKAVAAATAAMLKDIGVQVETRQMASSDFSKIVKGREFDILYSQVTWNDPFQLAYLCQVYCANSELIKSGLNNPANDALIKSVATLPTAQEQYVKGAEAEVVGLSTYGILPTIEQPDIYATKKDLANYGALRFFVTGPENIGWQK